jgi:hypothetical protein
VRTGKEIKEWIDSFFTSKMGVLSENELKEKIGSEDFLLIQGASPEQLKLLEVANFVDKAVSYYLIAEGEPKITLYLKKDSRTLDYTGQLTLTDLVAWTIDASSPAVVFLDSEEQTKSVFENKEKLPAFLLYRLTDFSDDAFSVLSALCEENKAAYRCAYVDSKATLFQGVARYLKLTEPTESFLAFVQYGLKQAYKFPTPSELSSTPSIIKDKASPSF